jgi:ABC-type Fe3+/spermidine/putrescine transport system ATPase subunit
VEQVGSPEEIYLRPQSRFVAGFLGAVNWINGVGIRPESVRLEHAPGERGAPATVTGSVFLGDRVQVQLKLGSGEDAVAQLPRSAVAFQPGDAVHLAWNAADEMSLP